MHGLAGFLADISADISLALVFVVLTLICKYDLGWLGDLKAFDYLRISCNMLSRTFRRYITTVPTLFEGSACPELGFACWQLGFSWPDPCEGWGRFAKALRLNLPSFGTSRLDVEWQHISTYGNVYCHIISFWSWPTLQESPCRVLVGVCWCVFLKHLGQIEQRIWRNFPMSCRAVHATTAVRSSYAVSWHRGAGQGWAGHGPDTNLPKP